MCSRRIELIMEHYFNLFMISKVKEIVMHPQYNKRNLGNTAAILILEEG